MTRRSWLLVLVLSPACTRRERAVDDSPETTVSGGCPDTSACTERCEHDDGVACLRLGNELRGRDDPSALRRYERACALDQFVACAAVGRMYEFAHGVARDDVRALRSYERSCQGGATVGCYSAAVLLERGQGAPPDLARAHELYARVCRAGAETACRDERRTRASSATP